MIHDTQSAQISQKQDRRNIYVIMKTMSLPGYHHNGFMATYALGHIYICCTLMVHVKFQTCAKGLLTHAKVLSFMHWIFRVQFEIYAKNDGHYNKVAPEENN